MKNIFSYFVLALLLIPSFAKAEGEVLPWQKNSTPATTAQPQQGATQPATSGAVPVQNGTTAAPAIAPVEEVKKIERPSKPLASISFAAGDQQISQQGNAQLDAVVNEMKNNKDMRIGIDCFASKPEGGQDSDARMLSLRRGIAARKHIIDGGVEKNRINIRAFGEPAADDSKNKDRIDILTY